MANVKCYVIDKIVEHDENKNMSPHFKFKELACKCCGEVIINRDMIALLEAIRVYLNKPIKINSFYRCSDYNNNLENSYKRSKHMMGEAADLDIQATDFTEEELNKLFDHAVKNGCREIGVYNNFIHFSVSSTSRTMNRETDGIGWRMFRGE